MILRDFWIGLADSIGINLFHLLFSVAFGFSLGLLWLARASSLMITMNAMISRQKSSARNIYATYQVKKEKMQLNLTHLPLSLPLMNTSFVKIAIIWQSFSHWFMEDLWLAFLLFHISLIIGVEELQ